MMNIFAFTENNPDQPTYPGFVSINKDGDGNIVVSVREQPKVYEGKFICANQRDAGPGRCVAGDANCNNYCNMAPDKGPMQKAPKNCTHIKEGRQISFTVPADKWTLVGE